MCGIRHDVRPMIHPTPDHGNASGSTAGDVAGRALDGSLPAPGRWVVDPARSSVGFVARHLLVTRVHGRFAHVAAEIVVGDEVLDSAVTGTAAVGSLITGDTARDDHLRSPDFFDAERWPEITLTGSGLQPSGRCYALDAELTIRDVRRNVRLAVAAERLSDGEGGTTPAVARFAANGTVNRREFGLHWHAAIDSGGIVVGDMVDLVIDAVATLVPAS